MLGTLRYAIFKAPTGLEEFPGSRKDLARHQEGNQLLGKVVEVSGPLHQVIFMAPVGVAHEISIVLEDRQGTAQALLTEPLLGIVEEVLENALASFVVDHQVQRTCAFWGGILRMATR